MKLLLLGAVGKPQGLAGGVYVHPFNPDSVRLAAGSTLQLVDGQGIGADLDVVEREVERVLTVTATSRGAKGRLVCHFRGVAHRDQAAALRGKLLCTPLETLEDPTDSDEFFFHEVKGWQVVDTAGTTIGHVVRAVETYAELLEVAPAAGGETFFVPVVKAIVLQLDREARRVVIDPPPGLVP